MIVVHRIALDPSKAQEDTLKRSAGTARFAYNWALNEWQEQYKAGGKPTECSLRKLLNEIKAETFPWMLEVSKTVIQQAIKNLGRAFANFFRQLEEYQHEPDPRRKKKLKDRSCSWRRARTGSSGSRCGRRRRLGVGFLGT